MLELVGAFLLVGGLAFGGGQAALPLVERLAVGTFGWVTPAQFGVAVGLSYATPGPVLIIAAYIGYRAEGLPGAAAATVAVFAVPVLAAVGAASTVQRLSTTRWLPAFGRTAGAAAIGLLAVTLLSLARPVVEVHPVLLTGSALITLAARRAHPQLLLAVAVLIGAVAGLVTS